MAEYKTIPIKDIIIPARLRAVEEEHALAIAQSIVEHGLINPITVRATPAAKGGKYTLVAGAHRLRGTVLNDDSEIEAIVVKADQDEAQLIEITENLFRNELSVIDRATFVASYRETWERAHGKIEAGRPRNRVNLTELIQEEAQTSFAQHVAERMGFSKSAVERLDRIAQHLHPDLRTAFRGTSFADNQSVLLKMAKLEPVKQRQAAVAFRTENGDLKKALALIDDRPQAVKDDPQKQFLSRLIDTWERADNKTRAAFMEHIEGVAI